MMAPIQLRHMDKSLDILRVLNLQAACFREQYIKYLDASPVQVLLFDCYA